MLGVWRKKVSYIRVKAGRTHADRYDLKSHGEIGGINDVEANTNREAAFRGWARIITPPILQIDPLDKANGLHVSALPHGPSRVAAFL